MLAAFLIFCFLVPFEAVAQRGIHWNGSGQWGPNSQYSRLYNTATVETLNGEIVSVEKITPLKGMNYGLHLLIKTPKEIISVHLGPAWFLEKQDLKLEIKDKIEVKGSRIEFNGKPAIIAAEIKKGNDVLKLRDSNGFPVWSGWRRISGIINPTGTFLV
jgi:hypothetical protein